MFTSSLLDLLLCFLHFHRCTFQLRRKEKERQCDYQQTAAHNDEADPPGANEARVVVGDARVH